MTLDSPSHQTSGESENMFRLRNRLVSACADHEAGKMSDREFAVYVRLTVLQFTDGGPS